MVSHIYLFRHGMTEDNANGIFSGWRDSKLTKKGLEDAKIVALRLKNKKIQIAYQSSLSRSKDTLKEVLKFHPECNVIVTDDRIIERKYGKIQGMTHYNYISKNSPKKYDDFHRGYYKKPLNGESIQDVEKRVNKFLKELIETVKGRDINVAISAHGNSMRPIRKHFEKLSTKQMMEIESYFDNFYEYVIYS